MIRQDPLPIGGSTTFTRADAIVIAEGTFWLFSSRFGDPTQVSTYDPDTKTLTKVTVIDGSVVGAALRAE